MALSSAERAQCRLYLGYPSSFRYLTFRLESSLDIVDRDADVEALVRTQLAQIANVDQRILAQLAAGVKRVDDIEFFKGEFFVENFKLGMMYVGRLSILLGVPRYSNYFSVAGYLGDKFSAGGLRSDSASSNRILLG